METCNRLIRKILLGVGVWLLLSGVGFGLEPQGEQEIRSILSTCMDQVRERHTGRECDQFDRMWKEYGAAMVTYLDEYVADPCSRVRWYAYRSIILLGLDVNDVQARQKMVDKLVRRLGEEEAKGNWQYLVERLARFTSADFSESSRQLVRDLLLRALADRHVSRRGDIILLAGVADLRSELGALERFILGEEVKAKAKHREYMQGVREEIASNGGWQRLSKYRKKVYSRMLAKQYWQRSLIWPALRARARMGVKEDIARCIELVRSHPDEDYRVAWLLKELSYVRQPEVVDYLHKYLKSDKVMEPRGRDIVVGTYAQHAAKALGKMLGGFPHKKDYGLDKATIERCRKWMAGQKEWDIIR